MTARRMAASALAVGVLLAGCQSTVTGTPQGNGGNPTEPSFPTSTPSRTTSTTPPTTTSSSATAAPPEPTLAPQNGYVFIQTKSGQTRCQISPTNVGCEAPFTNPPQVDGAPANGVEVTADGTLRWIVGNLGDIPAVTLDYQTYSAEGWTIVTTESGTRFTNDDTHHGMTVATQGAEAF